MSQKHVFNVTMTCGGCSGAVNRVLKKLDGVENIEIDMEGQKVTVTSTLDSDKLLETIKKTGKECSYVGVA
ncbi:copper transport protein ATOX1 homolog [Oscarella lobularis]|uniref:copper transport protein ATOX1 homolog n=1 Tax=Oscarella lobularis TaxID=121494 RepID=UPI00331399B1